MRISVVTVCFNSAQTIPYTIQSFLHQTHPDRELLVVDGVSSDDTLPIVRSFGSDKIRVVSEVDQGIFDAMNKGLRLFSGDAVGFLNSDDAFHDETVLSRVALALEQADVVYGDLRMVDSHSSKRVIRVWRAGQYHGWSYRAGWMPPHPTFYVRRKVLEVVNAFNTDYPNASDYDFMLRAMESKQFRVAYVPHVLVDFKLGGNSNKNWKKTFEINLECLQSRRINLGASILDAAFFLRPIRRLFQLRDPRHYIFR